MLRTEIVPRQRGVRMPTFARQHCCELLACWLTDRRTILERRSLWAHKDSTYELREAVMVSDGSVPRRWRDGMNFHGMGRTEFNDVTES